MKENTYTCEVCGETFEKGLTDEEAAAQLDREFPGFDPNDCGLACDDCFKRMFPSGASS